MKKIDVSCSHCGELLRRYETKSGNYFCNTAHKSDWQRSQKEKLGYTKEWLFEQYITQKKSADQIARDVGRDSKRVWEWLRDYGIQTRPRGTDYGQNFKIGDVSPFTGKKHTQQAKDKIRAVRLKDGHVPYLRNGVHWLTGNKESHPNWKGGITADRQSVYCSQEWVDVVVKVWHRDNATCQKCLKHQNSDRENKFHIHHIVSFMVKELRTELSNLVLLCGDCHRWVHSKENVNKLFIKE